MMFVWPALAVAFAAFCVWLAVRIVNRRERWAKRTAVLLVTVALAYPLSTGPFVWLADRRFLSDETADLVECAYLPIAWSIDSGPPWIDDSVQWYLDFWRIEPRN